MAVGMFAVRSEAAALDRGVPSGSRPALAGVPEFAEQPY